MIGFLLPLELGALVLDVYKRQAQGSTEQASAVEELSATINDLHNASQGNRETAKTAKERADQASDQVRISNERMQEMHRAMSEILEGQKDISKIIETIENIAFQTNILDVYKRQV